MKRKSPVVSRRSGLLSNGSNTPKHMTPQSSTTLSVARPSYGGSEGNTPSSSAYLTCWPLGSTSIDDPNAVEEVTDLVSSVLLYRSISKFLITLGKIKYLLSEVFPDFPWLKAN